MRGRQNRRLGFRNTAAKLRRDAGESIESESRFLDQSSRAVRTVYRGRLEEVEDLHWGKVAAAIGVGLVDDSPGWNFEGADLGC